MEPFDLFGYEKFLAIVSENDNRREWVYYIKDLEVEIIKGGSSRNVTRPDQYEVRLRRNGKLLPRKHPAIVKLHLHGSVLACMSHREVVELLAALI